VVRGFSQQPGIDYGGTFSLVIKPATIRVVLSIAMSSWPIHQLDIKNFLHDSLSETVYCTQRSGFLDASNPSHVCKLNKSLYGSETSSTHLISAVQTISSFSWLSCI
jgi:hypothetical protein